MSLMLSFIFLKCIYLYWEVMKFHWTSYGLDFIWNERKKKILWSYKCRKGLKGWNGITNSLEVEGLYGFSFSWIRIHINICIYVCIICVHMYVCIKLKWDAVRIPNTRVSCLGIFAGNPFWTVLVSKSEITCHTLRRKILQHLFCQCGFFFHFSLAIYSMRGLIWWTIPPRLS